MRHRHRAVNNHILGWVLGRNFEGVVFL